MLPSFLQFVGGLILLIVGGRLLVFASVSTARRLGVSPLLVGLTLVAWGTSAPELALNLTSAMKGRGDLALGNVVGANICNIALVLGLCALIRPLVVQQRLISVEVWLNAAILLCMALLGVTWGFERWEMGLMLLIFGGYSVWTVMSALQEGRDSGTESFESAGALPGWFRIGVSFAAGLLLLGVGGSLGSDGASGIALRLGVPPALVGVTIVSVGTTLPEVITGLMAVRQGQADLAVGNAIGSCLFNAGMIFGMAGLISPPAADEALRPALLYMAWLAVMLIPMVRTAGRTISRMEGLLLLGTYVAFIAYNAWKAVALQG
jgi:cation:H+ antiporter